MVLKRLSEFANKWGKCYRHIKLLPEKENISYYFNYLEYEE